MQSVKSTLLFGQFCFNKLPIWISSTPVVSKKQMGWILLVLDGVASQIKNVCLYLVRKNMTDWITQVYRNGEPAWQIFSPPSWPQWTTQGRERLSTKWAWVRVPEKEQGLSQVKTELKQPKVLMLYDPQAETKTSVDVFSHGLGAILLQRAPDWRPVAYASWSMTSTERCYGQIKKEALAITCACQKFLTTSLGVDFEIFVGAIVSCQQVCNN